MFDLINGLPVHPLVVHAVVVLLPLAILGTVAIAVRPAWREKYGWLVIAAAGAATLLIPVSTSSGEALEERVGDPGKHAALGDQLIWFAIPLLVLDIALVLLDRRARAEAAETSSAAAPAAASSSGASRALTVVAALSVIAGVAAGIQVYRVGDTGARAAWGDQVTSK